MDSRIKDLIAKLQKKLIEYQKEVDVLQGDINDLKNKAGSQIDISGKEKELNELKVKLIECERERDDVKTQIALKIQELNNSNLSNKKKSKEISRLMVNEYQQLKKACQKITQMWSVWCKEKDSLMELEKMLSNSRLQAIKSLEKTKRNLWIIVWVLLGIMFLLSFSLLCVLVKKTKRH